VRSVAALLTLAALAGGTGCIASAAEQPASSAASADETGAAEREARQVAAVVDPLIRADIAATGIPGAAFVFVSDGRIVYQQGYGVSDVASRTAVDPETTVWPIASITKVITAIAALQLVDQGRVDLDADLNRYLKRVRVPAQGYPPLTLRHLLTHTAALDELPGRQFDGRTAPDLGAFLDGRLLRYRAPGLLTACSTYGMALAGVLVEDVSGQRYADYVMQRVLRPAGMRHARVMATLGDEKGVATPYDVEDGKAQAIPYEWLRHRARILGRGQRERHGTTRDRAAGRRRRGRRQAAHSATCSRHADPAGDQSSAGPGLEPGDADGSGERGGAR
jgi:CubicO group peptidase (beta-lactamase class C family)